MKNLIIFLLASAALLSSFQTRAQSSDTRVLWTYTLRSAATQDYFKYGCATTKKQPFNVEMCFSEKFRENLKHPIEAYVKYYSNGRIETFRVIGTSQWEFINRTTEYVYNTSSYRRSITLEDSSGRRSDLSEVFTPMRDSYGGLIRSQKLSGILPNGEVLPSLENYYVSPTYIKNY